MFSDIFNTSNNTPTVKIEKLSGQSIRTSNLMIFIPIKRSLALPLHKDTILGSQRYRSLFWGFYSAKGRSLNPVEKLSIVVESQEAIGRDRLHLKSQHHQKALAY